MIARSHRSAGTRTAPIPLRLADGDFRAFVDSARSRHNISDIVGDYTTLKRRGANEMVGLCPFHTERSPSFEVNDSKGTYHCWGCGKGGDAIGFLMDQRGLSFAQALEMLSGEEFPVVSETERAKRKEFDAAELSRRIGYAAAVWDRAVPAGGTPAEVYARSRGIIAPLPETVRFVSTPRWVNPETGEVGRSHPAMVCALQDVAGAVVGVQCVFLQDGGRAKFSRPHADGTTSKAKLSYGAIVGSAVRLGPASDHVVITEGPEDGLSLMQELPGKTVWVACGTALLSRVVLPSIVSRISLAGDRGTAGEAAVDEARAAYLKQGVAVDAFFPEPAYKDWNDQLRGIRS